MAKKEEKFGTSNPIVNTITGYVEEHSEELLSKALLTGDSQRLFNLITDVKGDQALNIMDVNPIFQSGANCGWSESGTTEFTQRVLHGVPIKVNMAFCDKKLLKTVHQHLVKIAAGTETLPFEEKWTGDIVDNVKAGLEKMIYQGQSGQTNEFEGLISILEGASASTTNVSAATGTAAYTFLKKVVAAIPEKVKDPVILVSSTLYREYMLDLVAANLYHYDPADGANEYKIPGTNVRVIGVDGLIGTEDYEYAIAANLSNLFYGVDLENDEEKFDLWYSKDNQEFRLAIEFIGGVQVAFPAEVTVGKRARS